MLAGKVMITFDPENNVYYTASGKTIKEGNTGEQFLFEEEITSLAISKANFIIGSSSNKVFKVNDLKSLKKDFLFDYLGRINTICARGNIIATGGWQDHILIAQENMEKKLSIPENSVVLSLSISPDQQHISAFVQDGSIYFFTNLDFKKKIQVNGKKLPEDALEKMICDFSPNSRKLGIPGDMLFRYIESSSLEYSDSPICYKVNISILKWPKDNIIITACIDNNIYVSDIEDAKHLYTFQATSVVWDMVFFNEKIVAAVNGKEEVFENIKTENNVDLEDSQKAEENEEKNFNSDFFDRVVGIYPQEPLLPLIDDKSFSVLFRSVLGSIVSREYNSGAQVISKIEIEFDDSNFHSHISIPNTEGFAVAYMNEEGVFLASQNLEAGLEDFVSDLKSSVVYFQGFNYDVSWQSSLPGLEVPQCLCICNFCIVYTSLNYLRFFNYGGIQIMVLSMPGPVITLTSFQSSLAMFMHSAAPVLGCQSIYLEFWYMNEFGLTSEAEVFKEEYKVALGPEKDLIWAGFSDDGNLYTVDSGNVVRVLWKRSASWIPVCTLEGFIRIVGVSQQEVFINPKESPRLVEGVSFQVPLCKSKFSDFEQKMISEVLLMENGESDKQKKILEIDKDILHKFTAAVDEGDTSAAFGIAIQSIQKKAGLLCIKYAQDVKSFTTVNNLAKFLSVNLPPRLKRPEKTAPEVPVEPAEKTVKAENKEITKENKLEKTEQPKMPFSKSAGLKTDLFEALSTNLKRKPEMEPSSKRLKK